MAIDFDGTSGDDTITPTFVSAGVTSTGSAPSSVVEFIRGWDGNDTIDGGGGGDNMYGGQGDDLIYLSLSIDQADGGDGIDTLDTTIVTTGLLVILGNGTTNVVGENVINFENIVAGIGDDVLIGSSFGNLIKGGAGRDLIRSGAGNDEVWGGSGIDTLDGGNGSDRLYGGGGRDEIAGWAKDDRLFGGSGKDRLEGGGGSDKLFGGAGADAIRSGAGDDTLFGGKGSDRLFGGGGHDVFVFNDGDSVAGPANDRLNGATPDKAFEGAGAALGDLIDLSRIDADLTVAGDQAFVFGGAGKGHLRVIEGVGFSVVQGNTDSDAGFEFQLLIRDGAVLASDYTAADFIL